MACPKYVGRFRTYAARFRYFALRVTSTTVARCIAVPPQHRAGGNHGATDIADHWRRAPGAGSIALRIAVRSALEPWASDKNMAGAGTSSGAAEQLHQRVARGDAAGAWAGVSLAARAAYLPRRYAGKPDARSLATPDWAIAVPHPDGRADEGLPAGHDRSRQQKRRKHQRSNRDAAAVMRPGTAAIYRSFRKARRPEYHSSAGASRGAEPTALPRAAVRARLRSESPSPRPARRLRAIPRGGGPDYLHRLGTWRQNRTKKEQLSTGRCSSCSREA